MFELHNRGLDAAGYQKQSQRSSADSCQDVRRADKKEMIACI